MPEKIKFDINKFTASFIQTISKIKKTNPSQFDNIIKKFVREHYTQTLLNITKTTILIY